MKNQIEKIESIFKDRDVTISVKESQKAIKVNLVGSLTAAEVKALIPLGLCTVRRSGAGIVIVFEKPKNNDVSISTRLVITTNKKTALAVQSLFRSGNNNHRSVQLSVISHEKEYSNMVFLLDQTKPSEQHFADMFFIGNFCNIYKSKN